MRVTCFQTLEDLDNIDHVEFYGPFKCERSDAWLGHGFYFWDRSIDNAHNWGKKVYLNKAKKYIIGSLELDVLFKCFDLHNNPECQDEFEDIFLTTQKHPKFKGKIVTVPQIIELLKKSSVFHYHSIRVSDLPDNLLKIRFNASDKRTETTYLKPRIQICVIHPHNVFLSDFNVIYPK
jgi:hypothetical protein